MAARLAGMIFRDEPGIEFRPPPALDSGNGSVAFRKFDPFVFGAQEGQPIEIQIGDDQPLALQELPWISGLTRSFLPSSA